MRRGSDGGEQEGMTRLYISIGRRHGVRTSELIDYLKAEGGVGSEQLGNVTLRDRHTFVNVDSAIVDDVIARISGKELKDRSLRVEPAKA